MPAEFIRYRGGYKYQLHDDYAVTVNIHPAEDIVPGPKEFIALDRQGNLVIKAGYAWDGPSGPTFDTPDFMRGSLVHDALYQLMRHAKLGREHRDAADRELERICVEDDMSPLYAKVVYFAVSTLGEFAIDPVTRKVIHQAPEAA